MFHILLVYSLDFSLFSEAIEKPSPKSRNNHRPQSYESKRASEDFSRFMQELSEQGSKEVRKHCRIFIDKLITATTVCHVHMSLYRNVNIVWHIYRLYVSYFLIYWKE